MRSTILSLLTGGFGEACITNGLTNGLTKRKEFEEILTDNGRKFLEFVQGFQGNDKTTVDLAFRSYDSAASSGCAENLHKVLDALEIALFKNKQKLSDGLTFSLCLVAFISRAFAEGRWRPQLSVVTQKIGFEAIQAVMRERELAVEALFSLVKATGREDCLFQIYKAAEGKVTPGKSTDSNTS